MYVQSSFFPLTRYTHIIYILILSNAAKTAVAGAIIGVAVSLIVMTSLAIFLLWGYRSG